MFDLTTLNEAEHAQVSERLEELTHLVRLISLRPELSMVVGEENSPWSFSFSHNRVSAPVNDLINESADYCRGLTLHEAAHATITRIFDLLHPSIAQKREYHSLFNVIEDCRIETWIMERSPGAIPWIKEYNDKLFTPFLERPQPKSLSGQYLGAILSEWWFKKRPDNLDPKVIEALDDTKDSIQKSIAARPPSEVGRADLYSDIYDRNRSLSVIYLKSDYKKPPSDFEKAIRLRQLQMVIEVTRNIFPVYDRLLLSDQEDKPSELEQELDELLELLRGDHLNTSGQNAEPDLEGDQSSQGTDDATEPQSQSNSAQNDDAEQMPSSAGQSSQPRQQISDDQLREELQRALDVDPKDKYLSIWQKLSVEIDVLGQSLMAVLEARSKAKWLRGYAAGTRLDLRQAMAFEADPKLYQKLWMKQTKPNKIDPAFIILLDLSGSMEGENIEGAFNGLVLLIEVCTRLNIPVELITFNHKVNLVKQWEDLIDEDLRALFAKLLNQIDGTTKLSKGLDMAQERLQYLPFKDRFIITLSDGEPDDPDLVHQKVKNLSNQNVNCLGVGIGENTDPLKRFFKDGIYNVTPMELATQLGDLLDQILR